MGRIHLTIVDADTGKVLDDLGNVVTDSVPRMLQMYADERSKYLERGIRAAFCTETLD